MNTIDADTIRMEVRTTYAKAATTGSSCCAPSCCSGGARSEELGYDASELAGIPASADLGLGCGNPTAIAALQPGLTVLDLGSGAGIDCFLAARQVGPTGQVIGVDMTPEMISRARTGAAEANITNVEFRLGEIEHLPVADGIVDVILSNCVVNLSPNKPAVYREAYRALKEGGRLALSDIVATAELPAELRKTMSVWTGCVSGASHVDVLTAELREAGFREVRITLKEESRALIASWFPDSGAEAYVVSADIEAVK